jgi:RNA polymerase sigma-70 factor (ECF subfamily)
MAAARRRNGRRRSLGVDRVAQLFVGLGRQIRELGVRLELTHINGQPGAICRDAKGNVTNVFALDILDGVVVTIRSVINPDKRRHLGPFADVRALVRRRAREPQSPAANRRTDEASHA